MNPITTNLGDQVGSASLDEVRLLTAIDDIPAQGQGAFRCQTDDGTPIGLYRLGDDVVAWRDVCPHEAAHVCRGPVGGTRLQSDVGEYVYGRDLEVLRCPWHGWEFDLSTGSHLAMGSGARLREYPVEVRDGHVYDASGRGLRHDRELQLASAELVGEALVLQLEPADGKRLPSWSPGAHLELELPSGRTRQYSLCGDDRDRGKYTIAVLRVPGGRGGSAEIHDLMTRTPAPHLQMRGIRNRFPLRHANHYLFLAGGIGVTPLVPMARTVSRRSGSATFVYIGKAAGDMPLAETVAELGGQVVETSAVGRPDLAAMVEQCPDNTAIYVCGPITMVRQVQNAVERVGRGMTLHTERFSSPTAPAVDPGQDVAFSVTLARSGRTVTVSEDESVLQALRREGIQCDSSCEEGWCGSCETGVLEGSPIHRDTVLDAHERELGQSMMICVSRALGPLTIDA